MKIIQSGLEYLAVMGVSHSETLINVKFLVALFFQVVNVSGNFAFLFHEASTFVEYANSIFLTSTVTTVAVCFLMMALSRELIFETIGAFEKLVEKSECSNFPFRKQKNIELKNPKFAGMKTPTLRSMYEETNRVVEKWSKLAFLAFARLTPIAFVFSKAALIYLIYYITDEGSDAFDLPYSMWLVVDITCFHLKISIKILFCSKYQRFPWNWRTPVGYFIAVIIQYVLTSYVFIFGALALVIGLGCILMGNSLVKDICASMSAFNDIANDDGNRQRMNEQLVDFIETHSALIELSTMCSDSKFERNFKNHFTYIFRLFGQLFNLVQMMCMVFFAWCLTVTCVSLLLFQVEIVKHLFSLKMISECGCFKIVKVFFFKFF